MPGVAYIILAYKEPVLLRRIIDMLAPAPVLLHIDAGTAPDVAQAMTRDLPPRVSLLPRRRTRWASFELVEAELDGLRAALELDVDHVATLSGQDIPLVWQGHVNAVSEAYRERSFCSTFTVPVSFWEGSGGLNRFRHYNFRMGDRWPLERLRIPLRRRIPSEVELYGGSALHVLSREHVRRIFDLLESRPEIERFWRRVWIPDESFLPSMLHMVIFEPAEIVQQDLWFIDWPSEGMSRHPCTLDATYLPRLNEAVTRVPGEENSCCGRLFARKVQSGVSDTLLTAIEYQVSSEAASPVPAW